MAGLLEEGEAFGQFLPPFAQHLKENILQKYPDSGQILKELIQNADDAGATEVSFLLDHTDYNTRGVLCKYPALQQYQGPALYAFNNGVFTEQDWEGIRATEQGAKRKDPFRIGRFGVGFNSVYHITDLPSVMSGDYILILDPLSEVFPGGGRRFKISSLSNMHRYAEFLPFLDKLGHSTQYPKTLFRFPLRAAPSYLSDTIYTPERMQERFSELLEDQECLLLFLKNINKVTFTEREDPNIPDDVLTTLTRRQENISEWNSFLQAVSDGAVDVEICHSVTTTIESAYRRESFHWLVKNKVYDVTRSAEGRMLQQLHVLPWVGVAMPIHNPTPGRVFCFLPLPSDPENATGLPVHVHGYFGLSDNRRSITWMSSDQQDQTTSWNTLLLTDLIPRVYAEMLEEATSLLSDSHLKPSVIYDCWPDPRHLTPRWKEIFHPFSQRVITRPMIHTEASGGQWIPVKSAYDGTCEGDRIKRHVNKVLLQCNVCIAELPYHVKATVAETYCQLNVVSPPLVRKILKKNPILLARQHRDVKMSLLEYTLSDEKYTNMVGLSLLPLMSKEFRQFKEPRSPFVYLASSEHPAVLLPGLKEQIVDDATSCIVAKRMVKLARRSVTQVKTLSKDVVVKMLPAALPTGWTDAPFEPIPWKPGKDGHPPLSWLSEMWAWMASYLLTEFEDIALIPYEYSENYSQLDLLPLRKKKMVYANHPDEPQLPSSIARILDRLGYYVLPGRKPDFLNHDDLDDYIASPTPSGILTLLDGRGEDVKQFLSGKEKLALRSFLANLEYTSLSRRHLKVLKRLPILQYKTTTTASTTAMFIAAKEASAAAPNDSLCPVPEGLPVNRKLLSPYDSGSQKIIRLLGIDELSTSEFLCEDIFPQIPSLSNPKVEKLMTWVLDRMLPLQQQMENFEDYLKGIRFVPLANGTRVMVPELFYPGSKMIKDLFAGEDVFPTGKYGEERRLSQLKLLGLKVTPTSSDIISCAQKVPAVREDSVKKRKAKAVFQYINRRAHEFEEDEVEILESVAWVPCQQHVPDGYPVGLKYYAGKQRITGTLADVTSKTMMTLVGSTMPILDGDPSDEFKSIFQWPKPPPMNKVVQHLQSVINAYEFSKPSRGQGVLSDMAIEIYQYFADRQVTRTREQLESKFSRFDLANWVWHGSAFTSPERVAVSSDMTFDLSPYLFVLPTQIASDRMLRKFFLQMGVSDTFGDEHVVRVLHDIQQQCGDGGYLSHSQLSLCIKIINFLTKNCTQPCTAEGLLVPTHDDDGGTRLVPPEDCMYCDSDWLRDEGHDYQLGGSFRMLHQSISPKMANLLGIPSLTHRLVQPTALGPGMKLFGQKEPITRRLKTIIDEYKEGPGIFYELIQNADDAGATDVKFAVDWRQNSQARKSLLSPGMAVCQGPALWAYNNKVFTDEDIQNITEISGATKKRDTNKIGRFGLGFNSVYHITDVPSFISRHYFVCFDPHTTHLSPMVNHTEPGVRVEWNRDQIRDIYSDQFEPYDGIFDCDIFDSDTYPATLFRFPFRTEEEAQRSEISSTVYDRNRMSRLLTHLAQNLDTLLLFTQHVRSVTVVEIDEEGRYNELMHVKSTVTPLIDRSLSHRIEDKPPSLLQRTSWYMEAQQKKRPPEIPSLFNDISIEVIDRRIAIEARTRIKRWLISSCIGSAESLRMAQSPQGRENGLLPCASVAAYLDADTNLPKSVAGKAFCFLPLPESTGLPVHVNAPFAIFSNRQGICKRAGSGIEQPMEVEWNKSLLRDAIPTAYLTLLQHHALIQRNSASHFSDPFCLWPNVSRVYDSLFRDNLVPCFYKKVVTSPSPPKVLLSLGQKWISIEEATFLDPSLRESTIGKEALDILCIWIDQQFKAQEQAVDLPQWVFEGFLACKDSGQIVERKSLGLNTLYNNVFCPAVNQRYLANHRMILNRFVLFLLDEIFDELSAEIPITYTSLQHLPCVPSSPQGTLLRCPSELVHPEGTVVALFDEDDQRFPYGEELKKRKRMDSLMQLGMMADSLPWELLLERATSCETLYLEKDHNQALERMSFLYRFVMKTPILSKDVKNMTHLTRIAVRQLLIVAQNPPTDRNSKEILPGFCRAIYSLLQRTACTTRTVRVKDGRTFEKCSFSDDVVQNTLIDNETTTPFIYTTGGFVTPRELAFENHGRAMKMLGVVPGELKPYSTFLRSCGVRTFFEATDFVAALENMAFKYGNHPLVQSDLFDSLALAENLEREHWRLVNRSFSGVEMSLKRRVFLPDREGTLRMVSQLAYNDAHWLPEDPSIPYYVHPDIPFNRAVNFFGVKTVRSELIGQTAGDFCDIGQDFGQGEELTDRIKGILESYSTGIDIFKELLQNADDAGATEVKFIYDTRCHSDKKIFDRDWKHLQGPALLVYNNTTFSQSDIDAIQKIGKGNKQEQDSSIGQFGVGFNAVYHLTDCPSFITDNDTMCIFDPHARYVPGATMRKPGRLIPVETLKDKFPDVLKTFLVPNEEAPLEASTLFRFPLRREEMPSSKITDATFAHDDIYSMMASFWKEANQAILFLNHIEKVSFATIKGNDSRMQTPECCVEHYAVRKTTKANLDVISNHIKEQLDIAARETRSGSVHDILSIPPVQETYQVVIEEINGNGKSVSRWLISERVGFNKRPDLHAEELSFARLKCIMPRVAVASLLEETRPTRPQDRFTLPSSNKFLGKAFCYLPLPTPMTCLPVHVNGNFALDSSRRNLASSGLHGKWNELLKTHLLAPAYFALLVAAREELLSPTSSKRFQLSQYCSLFPVVNKEADPASFNVLAAEVYRIITSRDETLLPVVVEQEKPPRFKGPRDCLFEDERDNVDDTDHPDDIQSCAAKKVLLSIGCNVVETDYMGSVYTYFLHAGCQVKQFSPSSVMRWLRAQPLPHLQNTCLTEDAKSLDALLYYCLYPVRVGSQQLDSCLHGAPLRLAQDSNLYKFNKENHVFVSRYHALVSAKYSHIFAHESLLPMLFPLLRQDPTATVIKCFDIQDLALLANRHSDIFPSESLIRTPGHHTWHPERAKTKPTTEWLEILWEFLLVWAMNEQGLLPIKDWQIIPSTRPSLFSLANAKTTFTTNTRATPTVLGILDKLQCPFVNEDLLGEGLDIIHHSLASPTSSKDVITVLEGVIKEGHSLEGILNEQESSDLLQHLQRDIDDLKRSHRLIDILRNLPVFETLGGAQRNLCGVGEVLVLDTYASAGPYELNALLRNTGCVVLKRNEALLALYEVVGVKTVSQVTLYVQYVLPAFDLLRISPEQRIWYITYVKDQLLPSLPNASSERKRLLQKLQSTVFIPNSDGELVTADQFYSPYDPLFVAAKDHVDFIQFPPMPFCDETWIDFLADVGLQTNMDPGRYLQCVKTVEEHLCGTRHEDTTDLEQLAKELVTYLFENEDHLESVLEEVSETCFIPCHRASQYLTDIHPSVDTDNTRFRWSVTSDHESLIWTTSWLLPEWATPPTDALKELLGVQNSPDLSDVIDNCVNICSEVEGGDVELNICRVMQRIYHFLQQSCIKSPSHCFEDKGLLPGEGCDNCQLISRELSWVPCVVVEVGSGHQFSVGAKVVFEMSHEDKQVFKGYIFRLSRKLSPHEALFRCLGVTERVTLAKYSLVLSELVDSFGTDASFPEDTSQWKAACVAVGRIVELSCGENGSDQWHEFISQTTDPILYLPTHLNTLVPSQDVVIIEGKYCDPSIVGNLDKKVLTPWLTISRVAVESIPEDFRPVFFKDITDETFSERSAPCEYGTQCPFRTFYAKTFLDEGFCRSLALAISVRGKFTDKSELIPKVRSRLAEIELHCYRTIELERIDLQNLGTLSHKGKERQAYLSVKSSIDGSSCADMYLKHNDTSRSNAAAAFNLQLAKALCDLFKEYDMDLESVLEEVMNLQPTTGTFDVVRYQSPHRYTLGLGSPCEEFLVSHRPDIDFQEGEIVAYRLPSAGHQEHVFHAIFAKVVKEERVDELNNKGEDEEAIASGQEVALLQTEETFQTPTNTTLDFERVFEIHVNDDDDEVMPVKVTDLYKIDETQAVQVMTEEEALHHVTQVLEEAWDLEEDDHKRVVGRLFLYWHPKSNPSDEDYARRVIEHVRNEIKRLLRQDEESSSGGCSSVDHNSYHGGFSVGRHGSNRPDETYEGGHGYPGTPRPRRFHSRRRSGRKRTGRSSHSFFLHDDSRMIQHQDVPRGKRKSHNRQLCDSDYDGIFSQLEDLAIGLRTPSESRAIGFGAFGGFSSRDTCDESQPRGVTPNHDEARRWFEQAKNDFLAAKHCGDGGFYCNAASMCHQAAEKALKAALFVVEGRQQRGHGLSELARTVAWRQPAFNEVLNITRELSLLRCNNVSPRYPDQWSSPVFPAAAYNKEAIGDMLSLTDTVLGHVSSLL
ncbi:SACS [Branchiostoma lanceolatum]|uniref:SACS protein n=1 Tax=Branchiostoma lanceolatum TaxID=7740 RepID=A0A8J9ZZ13_BRALA|nr:SACS [Branchiostoma lanceolatum]